MSKRELTIEQEISGLLNKIVANAIHLYKSGDTKTVIKTRQIVDVTIQKLDMLSESAIAKEIIKEYRKKRDS